MPINPTPSAPSVPKTRSRGPARTRCSTRWESAQGRPTRPGSNSSSPPRTPRKPPSRRSPHRSSSSAAGRVDFGDFNLAALLHGEQHITLHQTLPAEGTAIGQGRAAAIHDKGKAALVVLETDVRDADGNPWWTTRSGLFISGEGAGVATAGRRPPGCSPIVPPTSCTASTPAPTRRCSIASTATATPCTRTRPSPRSPASRPRSCTASVRTG